ncbi:sorting nexin-31 [Arapaima gigas]
MLFNIPATESQVDSLGGRYVVYTVFLDGILLCKVRYSEMHRWNEELSRMFKSCLPRFPPKVYLVMTQKQADDRRLGLEQYLQGVARISSVVVSEVFCKFLQKMQQELLSNHKLDGVCEVLLPDGRSIAVHTKASDTSQTILEAVFDQIGLPLDLRGYFNLFIVKGKGKEDFCILKKLVPWELPRYTLEAGKTEHWALMVRKSYSDLTLDSMVLQKSSGLHLLCAQARGDMERGWSLPTAAQCQELEGLLQAERMKEFLHAAQLVEHYGCMQMDICTCDCPEPDLPAVVRVGQQSITCCLMLPLNNLQQICYHISRVKSWRVSMLSPSDEEDFMFELSFEYKCDSNTKWITVHSKQAFFLSTCMDQLWMEWQQGHADRSNNVRFSEAVLRWPSIEVEGTMGKVFEGITEDAL